MGGVKRRVTQGEQLIGEGLGLAGRLQDRLQIFVWLMDRGEVVAEPLMTWR